MQVLTPSRMHGHSYNPGLTRDISQATQVHRIIDGDNNTQDPEHMWRISYAFGSQFSTCIRIDLGHKETVRGMKIWNYNGSLEDTYTGVKRVRIVVDGVLVSPMEGILVRKAPGSATFDFGQFIALMPASQGVAGVAAGRGSRSPCMYHCCSPQPTPPSPLSRV